ncbi:hypothetical protein ACQ4OC_04100 [Yersinia sp. J1]|uniref:hypothetical protein n=1 Tax=Yersinia sp. J1 TaxID=3424774 RepID=UPI003D36A84B
MLECREICQRCAVFDQPAPDWAYRGICGVQVTSIAQQPMEEALSQHIVLVFGSKSIQSRDGGIPSQIAEWMNHRRNN